LKRDSEQPQGKILRRVPEGSRTLTVEVTYDKRLRTSARWTLNQETIRVRVPSDILPIQLDKVVDDIIARVLKQRARARQRDDEDLEQRARTINRQYFNGELRWHTIRWVSNMDHQLGSCTNGGTTDGDIRLSDRVRSWPAYVLDYVIAHELVHRKYPNHSPEFWDYLAQYPHTARARGFIEGMTYAEGNDPDRLV
jgi:predicted metal-dependent hydrolase